MSQASKYVKWCLSKQKKETEESKKSGKRLKHRGLLKIEPDIEKAKKHIKKAEHNLQAISNFKENGFSDWSIAAGFYSIYHCFLAIAIKFGYESRNQTCTIALIEYLKEQSKIDIDTKFIEMLKQEDMVEMENKIIDMREDYTYGVKISIEDETKINRLVEICREMIDLTKNIIF